MREREGEKEEKVEEESVRRKERGNVLQIVKKPGNILLNNSLKRLLTKMTTHFSC